MVPLACRILVATAAFLVPKAKRAEWKREWHAELWHRAELGAGRTDLLRCAKGVFRDASWFRETERKKHGSDLFQHPLRVEAIILCLAVLIASLSGVFRAPRLPYDDADRLFTVERKMPFLGPLDSLMSRKLPNLLQTSSVLDGAAAYRLVRDPVLGLRVSRNFFDVLGSKPMLGRTFESSDLEDVVVLPYAVWHDRLNADPNVIGRTAMLDSRPYKIIGVMPPDFWFRSPRFEFFAPFTWRTTPAGAVVRLKPGVSVGTAVTELRKTAFEVEPRWLSDALQLLPLLEDERISDLTFALEIALLAGVLGMGFLIVKRHGNLRYWLVLTGRIALTVLGLAILRMSTVRPRSAIPLSSSLFTFWIFLLVCSAAVFLLIIDHRGRCLVCLSKLRKPVAIGFYGSQIFDQPTTEYVCPRGHGTLCVDEAGNAGDHWTKLDESWQDLFVHND